MPSYILPGSGRSLISPELMEYYRLSTTTSISMLNYLQGNGLVERFIGHIMPFSDGFLFRKYIYIYIYVCVCVCVCVYI